MSNRNDIIMSQWIYFFHWCPLPDDVTSRAEDCLSKSRGANRPYCRMTCPIGSCYDIIVPTNRTDTFYDIRIHPTTHFFLFKSRANTDRSRPFTSTLLLDDMSRWRLLRYYCTDKSHEYILRYSYPPDDTFISLQSDFKKRKYDLKDIVPL